ncbi:MAG TPA: hypothetical protein VEK76_01535 [Candidatus Binatia bacterium]|nr:hypothetical protein [Candidatus Binatia bacterium]
MARSMLPPNGASLADVVVWTDGECKAVAAAIAANLRPRLWAARLTLEGRARQAATEEERTAAQGRLAAIQEAVIDLESAEALLGVTDAPVSWHALADSA